MKKILLVMLTVVSASFMTVSAQESFKPKAGSFSLEVGFSPLGLLEQDQQSSFYLPQGNLVGIYSISNSWGVRLGLGFASQSIKFDNGEDGDDNVNITRSRNQSVFSLAPGVTYSFKGTNKLSPYVGAEVMFATTSTKNNYRRVGGLGNDYEETETNVNNFDLVDDFYGVPFNSFGANLITGFNYYFAKNLYAGVEVGLGIQSMKTKKWKTEAINNDIEETEEGKAKTTGSGALLYANPQIRLGWAF